MPVAIQKRGRPKGPTLTTIGLPCKMRRENSLCAFSHLHTSEKKKVCTDPFNILLSCFYMQ